MWQILVIFGLHWAITSIMINNVQTIGFDTVMVGMFGASFAQVGAVIAIYLRTKNIRMKSLCVPAIVSGYAGVTEPAIYGITLPKTGHAVGMVTDDGMELLIHVGMDTVSLNGNGFVKKVSQGDRVKKGDLLLEFDLHTIEEAGLSAVTPVLVTNPAGHQEVNVTETEHVKPGDDFLTVQ